MKWLKLVPVGLLVIAVLAVATTLVLYETGKLPYKVYIVHTGSMTPTIPSKSAVLVEEGSYRVGEAVSFVEEHGNVVTHRLMAIHPDGTIVTKGDANPTADPWHHLTTADIIGKVVAAPHMAGYYLYCAKSVPGIIAILVCLLIIWLVCEVWVLAKRMDEDPTASPAP